MLKNLLGSYSYIFATNFSIFTQTPTPIPSEPFKRQSHKIVKHTQTIRQQFANELFECLTIFWNWRLKG